MTGNKRVFKEGQRIAPTGILSQAEVIGYLKRQL
jgi:hypothetical protein